MLKWLGVTSNFKTRKIRNKPKRPPLSPVAKQNITIALGIVLLLATLYYGAQAAMRAISGTRLLGALAGVIGKELKVDSKNHTNFLLAGTGGIGHEGEDLTDTLIIGSMNHSAHTVSLFSMPRDLYIESSIGGFRVNRLYEQGKIKWGGKEALDFLKTSIERIAGIDIHYVLRADFEALKNVVDKIGGIDVNVEEKIIDTQYPLDGTYDFETFSLNAGEQHLDGETALKYVRSRHSTSDFDRSRRQQQVLIAIKDKVRGKFNQKGLVKDLYYELKEHVSTDMSLREMLSVLDFAAQWDSKNILTATLNDEPEFRGGFLYTPLRELYGGAFVLLPAGDTFENMQKYLMLALYGPYNLDEFEIAVLNGTKTGGLASIAAKAFNRFGFEIMRTANARAHDLIKTTWYLVKPEARPVLDALLKFIPAEISEVLPEEYALDAKINTASIILELGTESLPYIDQLNIFKNIVLLNAQ